MYHVTGRAPREEEAAQGPREEAHHIHPPLRQRHHDRRQEEDEPQPHLVSTRLHDNQHGQRVGMNGQEMVEDG